MTTYGRSGLGRWLLGNVTGRVMRHLEFTGNSSISHSREEGVRQLALAQTGAFLIRAYNVDHSTKTDWVKWRPQGEVDDSQVCLSIQKPPTAMLEKSPTLWCCDVELGLPCRRRFSLNR